MREAIKEFVGRVPLQMWVKHQFAHYNDPNLNISAIQEQVFSRLKATLGNSDLARYFQLASCNSFAEMRRNCPLMNYEDVRPFIERAMAGDKRAIYEGRHIKLQTFAVSSGTTGPRKYIPINNRVVADLKRTWKLWGTHLYASHPDLMDCSITQITSSGLGGKTSGGIPFGDLSGFLAEIQPWYVSRFYTVPSLANKIALQNLKYYVLLRFTLANRDLRIMTTASPATLLRIAELANDMRASLTRDFWDGGISFPADVAAIPRSVRDRLSKPDRATAKLLESLGDEASFLPKNYWPKLKLLCCWTGGTMGHFKPILRDLYGDVGFRDIGLTSSEAHVTIPFEDNKDEGLLNLYSNIYEFESMDGSGEILMADQLEPGKTYGLIVTCLNGLLRYRTHDQIICTGHLERWPLLKFHNKGQYICDLTGEKLSAHHVSAAVEQCSEATGIRLGAFVVVPENSFPRGYRLLVEEGMNSEGLLERTFLPALDHELGRLNAVYQEHREADKLAPLALTILPKGKLTAWHKERLANSGGSPEQYKPPCLITDVKEYQLQVS